MTPNQQTLLELASRAEGVAGADRRILDRLDRSGDCWLWTGALDAAGRGRVWRNGKIMIHHRAVWEILVGPIPEKAYLCHHCDNPTCGNPAHLYVGDHKTNARDMSARRRTWGHRNPDLAREAGKRIGYANNWSKGDANPKAQLGAEQVWEIREDASTPNRVLAEKYGVNITSIQRIKKGTAWGHLRARAAQCS